jgi:hypothetical protein
VEWAQKVALGVAYIAFHTAFFMPLGRGTAMAFKQVVAAKNDEGVLMVGRCLKAKCRGIKLRHFAFKPDKITALHKI